MRVKRFIPLAVFALLALLLFKGLSIDPTALPAARLGQPFPDFSQPELLTEELIDASALRPGPALVNVWATWCYSCRVEHPYLLALAEQGVPIYGLNYKDDSEISVASGVVIDSNANHEFSENFIKAKALIDLYK